MTTLTINPIDGNDVVNASKAATGVAVSGTTGGVENGQIVTLRLNGNPYYATVSNGAWTTTIPANALAHATLADGTYSVTADVSSFAGDPATAALSLTVDETAGISINAIDGNNVVNAAQAAAGVAITGTTAGVENGRLVIVRLAGNPYYALVSNNTWSTTVPAAALAHATFPDGSYAVTADVSDIAGNPATSSVMVTVAETVPEVTSVTTAGVGITSGSGDLKSPATVTLTLHMNETVTVSGVPTLTLNDGGTATYQAGSGTNALAFTYHVAAGDNTDALAVSAVNLNGSTILDAAANPAVTTGALSAPAGTLQIDTTAPTVTSIAASGAGIVAGAGDVPAGTTITLTVTMSEAVTNSDVNAVLDLNNGESATYVSGSGTDTLTFSYVVQSSDDVNALAATGITANAGAFADLAGNAADFSGAGALTGTLKIDTVAPTVTSVVASGPEITDGAGTLDVGGQVSLTLNMSETVTVDTTHGTPTLTLDDGGTATYVSGSGTTALVFGYTVGIGEDSSDLSVDTFNLNGATILDAAGNAVDGTGASANPTGILQVITPPVVTSVDVSGLGITAGDGDLNAGHTVSLTVNTSEAVTVANGTPTLGLSGGGVATYASGSGTNALVFNYTVGATQDTADLIVNSFNTNGSSVRDTAGNDLAPAGLFAALDGTLQIDTTAPVVNEVTVSGDGIVAGDGDIKAGSNVLLTVSMSEAVTITGGPPQLLFSNDASATYLSGSGTDTLVFQYDVASGDSTAQLTISGYAAGGATVRDAAGNNANFLGLLGAPGTNLQIDTIAPFLAGVTVTGTGVTNGSGDVAAGAALTFTIDLSEAVTVQGGTPTLDLNDGGTATYASGSGSNALTFSYTVGAGENTSALAVSAFNANGAVVSDGAGNAADLGGLTAPLSGTLQVDTTAPTISSIATSGVGITNGAGDLNAGTVQLTVTLDENVTVDTTDGMPTLSLNNGGTATYVSGSGSSALVFSYSVVDAQDTADLTVTGLTLNGATVKDSARNSLDGSGAVVNPDGVLQIDTTAPEVTSVTISGVNITDGDGDVTTGAAVLLTLNMSEAVTVSGTPPTLGLNSGGSAVFVSGSGTDALVFRYVVGANENTADLSVDSITYDGLSDAAGNTADVSGVFTPPAGTLQVDTIPPTITINPVNNNGLINASEAAAGIAISGTTNGAENGQIVSVTLNGNTYHGTVEGGFWSASVPALDLSTGALGDGSYSITANVADRAGQAAVTATGSVLVDETASITMNTPGGNGFLNAIQSQSTLSISGTTAGVENGRLVTVRLNGAPYYAPVSNGVWTATIPTGALAHNALPDGTYTVTADVSDLAANPAAASHALVVDETAPLVSGVAASGTGITGGAGNLMAGATVALTVTMTEAVTVADGVPTLSLNDGGTATYVSGSGTNALVFSYTVASAQNTPDLAISAINLNGASVTDQAGNPNDLTSVVGNPAGVLTIDTIAPDAPTGVTLVSDSGLSQTDDITKVALSTFTGTGENGATVTLLDGSTVLGTGLVTDGGWSITATTALVGGANSITATQVDVAGNTSTASTPLVVTLDTLALRPAALTLVSDSGFSPTDDITNVTLPTFTGTGENGATVTLRDGSTVLGTGLVTNGVWSITATTALVSGANSITATQVDVAGNTSAASPPLMVTLDTVALPPAGVTLVNDSGLSSTDDITNVTLPTFTGTGENGATVTLLDGSTVLGTGLVTNGGWSITATTALVSGANSITATQVDVAGNISTASTPLAVTLDTVALPPAAVTLVNDSGLSPTDHITNVTLPTFTGTGENGATVTLLDGSTVLGTGLVTNGGWSITATTALISGANSITATQVDVAGNTSTASTPLVVTLDTVALAPAAVTLVNDSGFSPTDDITNVTLPTFTGTGEDGATVTLLDGSTVLGTGLVVDGGWSITATTALVSGANSITATQVDVAGNMSAASTPLVVTLDTVALAPAAVTLVNDSGLSPTDNLTNVTLPTFTGTGENGATVTLLDGSTVLGTGLVTNGGWSIAATTALLSGANSITATQVDVAGNTSTASTPLVVTLDTIAPTVTTVAASGQGVTDGVGDLAAGASVTLTVNMSEAVTVTGGVPTLTLNDGGTATYLSGSGTSVLTFGYTVSAGDNTANLKANSYSLNGAQISDLAGNAADLGLVTHPLAAALQIDTTPPAAPTVPVLSPASDHGPSNADAVTNATTLIFTGSAEANSHIALFDGLIQVGSTVADGEGGWSITANTLAEGGNVISARATDAAGNTSIGSASQTVTIDTAPPVVSGLTSSPTDAVLGLDATVTLTLGMSEAVTVSGGVPTLTLNNGAVATYLSGSGTNALAFTYTVGIGQTTPNLEVTAANLNGATVTDQAGNVANLSGATVALPGTLAVNAAYALDTTTGLPVPLMAHAYTGPVVGLQQEYVSVNSDSLNITATSPNWFIHTGAGDDAIAVSSGNNVLDGGAGSNFLVGGSGHDTFFVDARGATADTWSTIVGFHAGDSVTLWGVTPNSFAFNFQDNLGAAGSTGLTLSASAPNQPNVAVTFAGFTTADLSNGRISQISGTDTASGSVYTNFRANS